MATVGDFQVEQFRRDGFVRGPCVLSGDRLAAVRDAVDALADGMSHGTKNVLVHRGSDQEGQMIHVVGSWLAEASLAALVKDEVITAWVCRLMNTERVRLFRDQVFIKRPRSKTIVPWHQDYSDWVHTVPNSHITCWIALDDVTVLSGCMQYIPRTHSGASMPKITAADDFVSTARQLPANLPQPVLMELPAGHCVFHHCLVVHGSTSNRGMYARRAIAIAYMDSETRSNSGTRPSVPNGPIFPLGSKLEGPLFPLVSKTPE